MEEKCSGLSASELWSTYSKEEESTPFKYKYGMKEVSDDPGLQSEKIQSYYEDRKKVLSSERVKTSGSLSIGEWKPDFGKVELTHIVGNIMGTMGEEHNRTRCLFPEEALFLVDKGGLDLRYEGISLSLQEAYSTLLDEHTCTSHNHYLVYSYLVRLGYIIRRHHPSYNISLTSRHSKRKCQPENDVPMQYDRFHDKKLKLHEKSSEHRGGVCVKHDLNIVSTASEINSVPDKVTKLTWDFSQFNFPDASGVHRGNRLNLNRPSNDLLPSGVDLRQGVYSVNTSKIDWSFDKTLPESTNKADYSSNTGSKDCTGTDHKVNRRLCEGIGISAIKTKPDREVVLSTVSENSANVPCKNKNLVCYGHHAFMSVSAEGVYMKEKFPDQDCLMASRQDTGDKPKNWAEYKNILREQSQTRSSSLPDAIQHLWQRGPVPLVKPQDAACVQSIFKQLNVIHKFYAEDAELKSRVTAQRANSRPFNIVYDIFQPNSKFKKSAATTPNYHVCVVSHDDSPPTLNTIIELCTDAVPVLWAVVSNGDVNFYCFQEVTIPKPK